MKKLSIIIFLCSIIPSTTMLSQSYVEEVDLLQSVFGMEKKAMVMEFIDLTGTERDAFWTLYDEYELKRKNLGKKRISLLNRYVTNYGGLDDKSTNDLMVKLIQQKREMDNIIISYYRKIKKASGVKAAAMFMQFEYYVLSTVRTNILKEAPFISDLGL